MGFSLVVVSRGYSLIAIAGNCIATAMASLVAEHRLWGAWASVVGALGLSSYCLQAGAQEFGLNSHGSQA